VSEKKRSIHKVAIELLKKDPEAHFETLAELYHKADVPIEQVRELTRAFEEAGAKAAGEIARKCREIVSDLES
jgi:hypothetical protein